MEIKKGELWKIATSESDDTIRVLEDIKDTLTEQTFQAERFTGKTDEGTGEKISLNTKSVRWRAKIY